jgi:hypothetical protein
MCTDIDDMTVIDGARDSSVDECSRYVCDVIQLEIGAKVDSNLVRSTLAHITPHVLPPVRATCFLFLLSDRMHDVVGCHGAATLRCKLIGQLLRIPGETPDLDGMSLLQDSWCWASQSCARVLLWCHGAAHACTHVASDGV